MDRFGIQVNPSPIHPGTAFSGHHRIREGRTQAFSKSPCAQHPQADDTRAGTQSIAVATTRPVLMRARLGSAAGQSLSFSDTGAILSSWRTVRRSGFVPSNPLSLGTHFSCTPNGHAVQGCHSENIYLILSVATCFPGNNSRNNTRTLQPVHEKNA